MTTIYYRFKGLGLLQTACFTALGVVVASHLGIGIGYDSWMSLLIMIIVLTLINTFLKPFIVFLTLPFIVITFGLFIWVINSVILMWVGNGMISGFTVASWSAAFLGSLIIAISKAIGQSIFGGGLTVIKSSRPYDLND